MSHLVGLDQFRNLAKFVPINMNILPLPLSPSYGKFDFLWSTCSIEHVGSIALGQRFVENAMTYLNNGGVAIHTVEFTISSNSYTVEDGPTVLWCKHDVERLVKDLEILGYDVYPIHWGAGSGTLDYTPDAPPFSKKHVKLVIGEFISTSFAIVVKKPDDFVDNIALLDI